MSINDINPILDELKLIALEAGNIIMKFHMSNPAFALKKDASPVSEADIASHQYIVKSIANISSLPIVSEEDVKQASIKERHEWFWLIDPLDGTKEFLSQAGEFTVNIALIGHGLTHFGIVYAPAIDLLYWGGTKMGAYRCHDGKEEPIKVGTMDSSVCRVVASKSHLNDETKQFIAKLNNVDLIQSGSSIKFCRVAEGSADIYPRLGPTSEWDTAAAQAVLEAAGGVVLDLNNNPLIYGKEEVLNPYFIATRDPKLIPL